jgi:Fe-Mn family superoxide dismutase
VLKPLPYASDALSPWISSETVESHYGKHHRGYVDSLNERLEDSRAPTPALETLVREASGDVCRLASQVWNHDFFWSGLCAGGGGKPTGTVLACLDAAFGGFANFRRRPAMAASSHFGSGWAWLVLDGADQLRVTTTHGTENPLRWGMRPLFAIDVWEHAYYLDVQNERQRYVEAVIDHLIDWEFVLGNLDHAMRPAVAVARGLHRKPVPAAIGGGPCLGTARPRPSQRAAPMQPVGSGATVERGRR